MQTSRGHGGFSDSTRGAMVLLLPMMEVGEHSQQNYAAATNI